MKGLTLMADLDSEIQAYDKMRAALEAHHMGKWVLVHEGELIGVYDSMESTAEEAVCRFGAGPYLIRQVGATSITLPASVMYHLS